MTNHYYPQHVEHPSISIPSTWEHYDSKWWPTTQPDHNGVVHKLAYTYPLHYISVYRLIRLNAIGQIVSKNLPDKSLKFLTPSYFTVCGRMAVEWMMAGFDDSGIQSFLKANPLKSIGYLDFPSPSLHKSYDFLLTV